jgi:hypothetical protein
MGGCESFELRQLVNYILLYLAIKTVVDMYNVSKKAGNKHGFSVKFECWGQTSLLGIKQGTLLSAYCQQQRNWIWIDLK